MCLQNLKNPWGRLEKGKTPERRAVLRTVIGRVARKERGVRPSAGAWGHCGRSHQRTAVSAKEKGPKLTDLSSVHQTAH